MYRLFLTLFLSVFTLSACQTVGVSPSLQKGETSEPFQIKTRHAIHPIKSSNATLILPADRSKPVPVVIMVHGTAGPDARYSFHSRKLLDRGIGVLQTDFKSGHFTGPHDRKRPSLFVPLVASALMQLREDPRIKADGIGMTGFSYGGAMTLQTFAPSFRQYMFGQDGFSAHAAYYPQCKYRWGDFEDSSRFKDQKKWYAGGPIIVVTGSSDDYGDAETCPNYIKAAQGLREDYASLLIIQGAEHGFDGNWAGTFSDPIAINGQATMAPNSSGAELAGTTTADFFEKYLK